MNYQTLTDKQKTVLEAILRYIASNGASPSIREIQNVSGIGSLRGVTLQLEALEKKGLISRRKGARGIKINKGATNLLSSETISVPSFSLANIDRQKTTAIPLMTSHIPAGYTSLVEEHSDENIDLPMSELMGARNAFAVKVSGDSMVDAGIEDGDIAVISPQPTANDGDIVAALVQDRGVTLKRLKLIDGTPILMPANQKYQPIVGEFTIQGKLINLIKSR